MLLRGYATSNTYPWNSTGAAAGTEQIGVWVKDATSSAPFDANTSIPFTVTPAAVAQCTAVTISAAPTSVTYHASGGPHVIATAAATGCTNSPRYEFWIRPASSSTWTMVQAYSALATYNWDTSGALPGVVYLGVHVKDVNSTSSAGYDVVASTSVTVFAALCTGATITNAPTTVVHSTSNGTHVIATAVATGCTNSPLYEFWIRAAGSSAWFMVQGYSATATYNWNSTGAAVGTVYIGVHVKDVNSISSAGYDVVASAPVTVT